MAELVACLAMSHAPQLMLPPDQWNLLNTRSWDPLPERPELKDETLEQKRRKWDDCHAAIGRLRDKLAELAPDTVIMVGDDQHENFIDDGMPAFALYLGEEVESSTSLRYLQQPLAENRGRYGVDVELGRSLLDQLMDRGFDPTLCTKTRYEGGLGHAFGRPLKFLLPDAGAAILPIMVNTYYPPAPSPKRCIQLGQALAEAIGRFPQKRRVAMVASGGLSHTKIIESLDADFLRALGEGDLDFVAAMDPAVLVEGTSEIRNWMVIAAAAAGRRFELEYYMPLYRTTNGVGCAMGFATWE